MRSTEQNARGFSLVELLVAVALGLIVLAATTQLFKNGMDATMLVTPVVRNAAERSRHAESDRQGCEHGRVRPAYWRPVSALRRRVDAFVLRGGCEPGLAGKQHLSRDPTFMYGIIPGQATVWNGRAGNRRGHGNTASDAITVIYADYAFPLNQYTTTYPGREPERRHGQRSRLPRPLPVGFPAIQSPTGIQVGDLILFSNNLGNAVGEVTGIAPGAGASTDINSPTETR